MGRWQGRLKTWNRPVLNQVTTLIATLDNSPKGAGWCPQPASVIADGETDGGDAIEAELNEVASRRLPTKDRRRTSIAGSKSGQASSSLSPRRAALNELRSAGAEKTQYKQEHLIRMRQLKEQREDDKRHVREKCEREDTTRERRFERMVDELRAQDEQRINAGAIIEDFEQTNLEKKEQVYKDWDENVYQRVTCQLHRFLNPQDRPPAGDGSEGLSKVPARRMDLHYGDDPMKRFLIQGMQEEKFKRTADSIIFGMRRSQHARGSLSAGPGGGRPWSDRGGVRSVREPEMPSLEEFEAQWSSREMTRPTMEPVEWGQQAYKATTQGFFASSRFQDDGSFHTAKLMGQDRHLPDEMDGVSSAGKTRLRDGTLNYPGMLESDWNKRGQTIKFKKAYGSSCGAPGQDHYLYETGAYVTDQEFPLAKRVFKHMH